MLGSLQKFYQSISRFGMADAGTDRDLDGLAPVEPIIRVNQDVTSGWESRSDDSAFKRYIVFEVGGIADAAAFRAWALENGLAFKSLQGSWKGRHNPAFIVEDTPSIRLKIAYWVRKQEALLCLGPAYRLREDGLYQLFGNREAILDWLEPDGYTVSYREPIGLFGAVSKATALRLEDWTFDPTENQYYAVG